LHRDTEKTREERNDDRGNGKNLQRDTEKMRKEKNDDEEMGLYGENSSSS
jgi:hypothetical protein